MAEEKYEPWNLLKRLHNIKRLWDAYMAAEDADNKEEIELRISALQEEEADIGWVITENVDELIALLEPPKPPLSIEARVYYDASDLESSDGLFDYDSFALTGDNASWWARLSAHREDKQFTLYLSYAFPNGNFDYDSVKIPQEDMPVTDDDTKLKEYFIRIWQSLAGKLGTTVVMETETA